MGCTQSKIENEEAVTRCKERKQLMKEAVSSRNAFAAAHSLYTMALKNTGAALSDYAHGEVLNPQHLQSLPSAASAATASAQPPPLEPPAPPPPPFNPTDFPPIQRATSMPEIKSQLREKNGVGPTIFEEDDEVEGNQEKLITRKRSSGSGRSRGGAGDQQPAPAPPAPPAPERSQPPENSRAMQAPSQQNYTWDYFFSVDHIPGPTLEEVVVENNEIEKKAFHDHRERPKIEEEVQEEKPPAAAAPPPPPIVEEEEQKVAEAMGPAGGGGGGGGVGGGSVGRSLKKGKAGVGVMGEKRVPAKGSVNLLQVFVELDDHFLRASESAQEVSKMLEATRLHYHSNFADNRGNSLIKD